MYRPQTVLVATRCLSRHSRFLRAFGLIPHVPIATKPFSNTLPEQTRMSTTASDQKQDSRITPSSSRMQIISPTELVVKQRLNRPVSPNLGIYSWKIMICGALHRNTAIILSGTMYLFGFAYLALPFFGISFGSADLVAWFGGLPTVVKIMIKWVYGFGFSFHFAHGMRHLIWDTGAILTNAQVLYTGYVAIAIGALAATGFCFV